MRTRRFILAAVILIICIAIFILCGRVLGAPERNATIQEYSVPLSSPNLATIASDLQTQGFIQNQSAFQIIFHLRNFSGVIMPGGYNISKAMNAWEIAGIFSTKPSLIWIVIPEGLRKEEIADILALKLGWKSSEEEEWITKDTVTPPDYFEGVYFPDTYLIPAEETPLQAANRLQAQFEEEFAPYAIVAANQNIKWTTALTLASLIQREAAGKSDMPLISGILWNRLLQKMKLQVDSTVQYARGKTANGWWAPILPADEQINSPYNTYLHAGLPPHPIDNPGLDAINAALNPASTTCLYYIHDTERTIHCATTYPEQENNIQKYLE